MQMRHWAMAMAVALAAALSGAADWPQFMRDGAHTGDAADEALAFPLGLVAQVKLDDAVLTSPAVVAGLVYVVDQMGTAYCVDPKAGRIVWKVSPDGERAMGSNTSSPCVAKDRVYYGTTAGTFHVLSAQDGAVVKTLDVGWPIVSSPTVANERVYFQALDAAVRCLGLDGVEKWRWDHYAQYREPPAVTTQRAASRGHPGSYDRPHYGGGEVAVGGKRLVTSFGWDIACIEDRGDTPVLVWCNRAPAGRDGAVPMSSSISGDFAYTAGMGADGVISLLRFSLADGQVPGDGILGNGSFPWMTPAVRGNLVACRGTDWLKDQLQVWEVGKRRTTLWQDPRSATPVVSSCALAKDHLVATTLAGEVLVLDLAPTAKRPAFRFETPTGKGIGSSPAVANGSIYFGADDGCLYVLGPGGALEPAKDGLPAVHEPRSKVQSATGTRSDWPSTCGNGANTCFVDDAALRAPLRVRWAARGFGHFKTPVVAADGDLFTVTLQGTVACHEQMTGRLRWRKRLPPGEPELANSAGLLVADGRLYVPRPHRSSVARGWFLCLDVKTGDLLWSAEIGDRGIWGRESPVLAAGKVAFASARAGTPSDCVVQAWDAATGQPAWQAALNVAGNRAGSLSGCTDGRVMFFTAGAEEWQWKQEGDRKRGETVAVDGATGRVLWRSNEVFGVSYPVLAGDRLFLNEYPAGFNGVDPKDGRMVWRAKAPSAFSRFSIGPDYLVARGYGGAARKFRLENGQDYPGLARGGQLGGDTHACGAVALTPTLSLAITVGGLNVRDVRTGALLWLSPGFAPRGCVNAAIANGRVFFPTAASGMVFCWEPEK